ncbi:MAG: aldo/keto reductase [Candidatus Altiarchaeales archaeon]|nr:aldo/keto reductase [Candidatus Altiarchaeales archaeon]
MGYANLEGEEIPKIGLGTWQMHGQTCFQAVKHALAEGYRHIDTAQFYENEQWVGEAIKESNVGREKIFLTTKIWEQNLKPEKVRESFRESLDKLDTDYVDLLLIHWPSQDTPLKDTLNAFMQLKDSGKIRHMGVSNFNTHLLSQAIKLTENQITCNQVEYHPYLGQEAVLRLCRENNITVTAYSPLARGRVIEDETITEIAERHGKTASQVALRWLTQQDGVIAIPKAENPQHQRENLDVFDFKLSQKEMSRIHALNRNERLIDTGYVDWD